MLSDHVSVSNGGRKAELHLEHVSFSDFDSAGCFSLWGLARLFECVRAAALSHPSFMDWQKLAATHMLFIFVCEFRIRPQFYETTQKMNIHTPVTLSMEVRGVTRKTLLCSCKVKAQHSKQTLAELDFRYVMVNRTTRRGQCAPEWFTDKYGCLEPPASLVETLRFRALNGMGTPSYVYEVTVAPSDIDRNKHTNNAKYVMYCCDCASMAARKGALRGFSRDLTDFVVSKARLCYIKETIAGDHLTVSLWPQDIATRRLYFQMENTKNGTVVFRAVMTYEPFVGSKL